jgi:lipoprotein-releasing system ATP-binding protein
MSDTGVVLAARQLCKSYREGADAVEVLRGVDVEVLAGETVAIVGASGSGKSSLLHCLGGLDSVTSGRALVEGRDLATMGEKDRCALRNTRLGFVYQFHHLLPEFSAAENVAMPLLVRRQPRASAIAEANAMLAAIGLSHRASHVPGELSGGERQRVALARALVTRPRCVLADEPTGNLDRSSAATIFNLMLELRREFGSAIVVVTHDRELAGRMDRCFELRSGVLTPA